MNMDDQASPVSPEERLRPTRAKRWTGRLRVALWCVVGLFLVGMFVLPGMTRMLNPPRPIDDQIDMLIGIMTSAEQTDRDRVSAAGNLSGMGSGAVPRLLVVARNVSEDHNSAILAVGALRTLGRKAIGHIDELTEMLSDENPFVVRTAARLLGGIGAEAQSAVETMIPLLGHADPEVRKSIVEAVAEIGSVPESTMPYLIGLLDEPDPSVRLFTMRAIIALHIEDSGVQEAIYPLLNATDPKVRAVAHEAWWEVEAARLGMKRQPADADEILAEAEI